MEKDNHNMRWSSEVGAYLRDESGMSGSAEKICFPKSVKDIKMALSLLRDENVNITIQGARTGLCAGAVPNGGHILNLTQMNKVTGFSYDEYFQEGSITVQAGVTLGDLKQYLKKKSMDTACLSEQDLKEWENYQKSSHRLWFLPNPTELNATLGAIAATDAVGAHIRVNGGTGENILSMKIVKQNGYEEYISGEAVKDFCGTEGTEGVIAELKLKLTKCPAYRCGLFSFHHTYRSLDRFFRDFMNSMDNEQVRIGAADWYAKSCLLLLEREKEYMQNVNIISGFPECAECALWMELWGEKEEDLYTALEIALDYLETEDSLHESALAAVNDTELERFEMIGHMITEAAGLHRDNDTALIDWCAKEKLFCTVEIIAELVQDTDCAMMGHMYGGMATLHILRDAGMYTELVMNKLKEMNCRYSKEHGCGKLKKELLKLLEQKR